MASITDLVSFMHDLRTFQSLDLPALLVGSTNPMQALRVSYPAIQIFGLADNQSPLYLQPQPLPVHLTEFHARDIPSLLLQLAIEPWQAKPDAHHTTPCWVNSY